MSLFGCTGMSVNHTRPVYLPTYTPVAILPFTNTTETPQADERAQAILADLLRGHGLYHVMVYPNKVTHATLIPGVKQPISRQKTLAWAKNHGAMYAYTGSVTEWNYKVGLDGEPAIGVVIEMIDVNTGLVVWSSVGSKSGGSRIALSTVAQDLMNIMLSSIYYGMQHA